MSRSLSTSGGVGAEAVCVCVRESDLANAKRPPKTYFSRLCFRAALQLGHLSLEEAMNAIYFLTLKMNTIEGSLQQLYLAAPTQFVNPHNKVSSQLPTALKGKGKTRSRKVDSLSKNHFHRS